MGEASIYTGSFLVKSRCVSSANRSKMLSSLLFSSLLISSSLAMVQPSDLLKKGPEPKDLLCDICIDIITDLDQWLTSDTTEDQIVEWIEQVCGLLSALVPEAICKSLIESQIPAIIDGPVNDNLNPQELCGSIGACTDAPTPAPSSSTPAPTTPAPSTPAPPTTAAPSTPASPTTAAPSKNQD